VRSGAYVRVRHAHRRWGWTGGKTGEHSVFAELPSDIPERPYEVMYHVSTLLPHSKKDVQQLERKRHLGNDVVVIVFQAGDTIFDPTCIASEFNRTATSTPPSFAFAFALFFSFVELTRCQPTHRRRVVRGARGDQPRVPPRRSGRQEGDLLQVVPYPLQRSRTTAHATRTHHRTRSSHTRTNLTCFGGFALAGSRW
jgi:hypothetical protein